MMNNRRTAGPRGNGAQNKTGRAAPTLLKNSHKSRSHAVKSQPSGPQVLNGFEKLPHFTARKNHNPHPPTPALHTTSHPQQLAK